MALKFVSIDIETTGLDPKRHGITEFAAVFTDTARSFEPKTFYRWINPEDYVWSNYCLQLHSKWIERVLKRLSYKGSIGALTALSPGECGAMVPEPAICFSVTALINDFRIWLNTECDHPIPQNGKWEKLNPAGKNFGSFDMKFLEAANWPAMFRHRAFDPTVYYFDRDRDTVLPELALCKSRAIAQGCTLFDTAEVSHSALDDAMDVAKLIWWINNPEKDQTDLGASDDRPLGPDSSLYRQG